MKFSLLVSLAVVALSASQAIATPSSIYDLDRLPSGMMLPRRSRHPISEQRRRAMVDAYFNEHPLEKRAYEGDVAPVRKRKACKAKTSSAKNKAHKSKAKSASSQSSSSSSGEAEAAVGANKVAAKTSSKSKSTSSSSSSNGGGDDSNDASGVVEGIGKGLLGMKFAGACPSPGASKENPNGSIEFLNCGISKSNPSSKWRAPKVSLKDLKVISAEQAAKSSAFKACSKYESAFKSAEKSSGIPAVVLMSFAMQESTCNPSVKGGNGEIGMMQLTPDKCGGKNCWDATTNIATGAHYFKDEIDRRGGNVLAALGAYNGWQDNQMTYSSATSQQYGCHAQNNLDYLMQMVNWWFQGKTGYSYKHYNNLANC